MVAIDVASFTADVIVRQQAGWEDESKGRVCLSDSCRSSNCANFSEKIIN